MKSIDVFYLTHRRENFLVAHARELACAMKTHPEVRNVYFLGSPRNIDESIIHSIVEFLGSKAKFENNFEDIYMNKLNRISDSDADYCIKIDEDCYMTSESWDAIFTAATELTDQDLFLTGCITNGVPTCDLYLQHHTPFIKKYIENEYFRNTTFFPIAGADYRSLNHPELKREWNSDLFWELLTKIDHPYQGVHPMRMNFAANAELNKFILHNFEYSLSPKNIPIIRDNKKYPHYCPQFLLMTPENLKKVLNAKELFFDAFEEVPLNLYKEKYNLNMVIFPGIPILHTMFNWSSEFQYEAQLIDILSKLSVLRHIYKEA